MNRIALFLVTCLFIISSVSAAPRSALDNSTLWKISGNGLNKPSYLFGTIHLICGGITLDTEVSRAIKSTDQLVMELDMSDPMKVQMEAMEHGRLKDGKTIYDVFSQEQIKGIDAAFMAIYGVGVNQFKKMEPMVIYSALLPGILDCSEPDSYEQIFSDAFVAESKNQLGLETVEFQMNVLSGIPVADQMKMIMTLVEDNDKARAEINTMTSSYREEDINHLGKLIYNTEEYSQAFLDQMLVNRNKSWIPAIEKEMSGKPTFIAVGAGHLVGEQGVIRLLRKRGYTVEAEM